MAFIRIPQLTEFTGTLADDDEFEMVDKSDTTDDPTGSSFKITKATLAAQLGGGDPLDADYVITGRIFGR